MLYSLQNSFKLFILLFCFFVYFFPFKIYGFEPRIIVFIIAIALFIIRRDKPSSNIFKIKKIYFKTLAIPFIIGFFSLIAIIANSTSDISFVIYPLQSLYLLLLSYAIFYILISFYPKTTLDTIIYYIILILFIQGIISIIMFLNPKINDFFFSLQGIDTTSRAILMYLGQRLIGLGCFYFGGGLIYGFGLILLSLILLKRTNINKTLLIFTYIILLIIGIFFARTCLIGAAISFVLLFRNLFRFKIKTYILNLFIKFFTISSLILFLLVFIYNYTPAIKNNYSQIVDFGFELFITYFEEGELKTDSTEGLKTMYRWPQNNKTYIIGDGRFIGDGGEGYYKNTDVGYLRMIYYFGLFGMSLMILQNMYIMGRLMHYEDNKYTKQMYILVFVYFLLLNLKGYIDFTPYMFIFLHYYIYKIGACNYQFDKI